MIASVTGAWNRFWFEPVSTTPLALFRIAYGLLVLAWALSVTLDVDDFFGPSGVLTEQPGRDGAWGVLGWIDAEWAPRALLGAQALAALALMVGYRPRVAAAVVFVAFVAFSHRNPYVGNAGDALLRTLSLFMVFAPSGAALSLDRWRKDPGRFWESPKRTAWAMRLIQVQISMLYISTAWAKARGATWNDGTAVSIAFRKETYDRFPLPDLGNWLLPLNGVTYGVIALELALGILIWNRALRPWLLLGGVGLHLGIEYGIRVGFFSWAMLASYLVWLSPAVAERIVARVRSRFAARGYARGRGEEEARLAPG